MWSFARQQKYNFCPRAFYFRYQKIQEGFSEDLSTDILQFRSQAIRQTSATFFTLNLAKEIFYRRVESDYELRKLVYREGKRLNLSDEKLTITFENLKKFTNSDFYQSTNPTLVNHIPLDENPIIEIGDKEVTGGVHLAWTDQSGKFFSVRISPKGADVNTAFAALYPIKKFQVIPENINVGALSTTNWLCTWKGIEWHEISDMQEQVLSFTDSEKFSEFHPTEKISHCELCDFSEICYRYSSELDLI